MMLHGPLLMLYAAYAYQSYPRPYRLVQAAQRSGGCALHSQRLPSDINSSRDITISSTVDCSHGTGDKKLFFSQKSFVAVGLSDKMVGVVSSMQISTPSKIQAIAFYGVNTRQHCIIADQTGSGKTLAYLLPTVQRMILSHSSDGQQQRPSPFIVVMTPTSELATQVSKVVKALANALKFRTACFTASTIDMDGEKKKLRLGADVVVGTPGRLLQLLERGELDLSALAVMVLDEADVLLADESFPLQPIGQACPASTQFLFTTATLPQSAVAQIEQEFPAVLKLIGPGLHRIAPNVDEVLVDCSGAHTQERSGDQVFDNKRSALLQLLSDVVSERTVVFCNTIDQCRRVENALLRQDRDHRMRKVLPYHGAIDAATRDSNLVEFCRPLLEQPAVLISTDRASRGMDFNKAHVDHVILFDFPKEPSEYLRRVGRTGRAGRAGRATILAYGRQVQAAKAVMKASIDGKKIDPDSGNG